MPFIFDFNYQHGQAPMKLKGLLGGKGANLAEMTSVLHLPVPPGFTSSTDACRAYTNTGWPKQLDAEVQRARRRLEKDMGRVLGISLLGSNGLSPLSLDFYAHHGSYR